MRFGRTRKSESRRGAAVVELAVVAPLLIGLLMSMIEICRVYDMYNQLNTAVRQGARLAAMDREGVLLEGESTNSKIEKDVRHFLAASGFDPEAVDIIICTPGNPDQPFNLDDPDNYLGLFELRVQVPYGDTTSLEVPGAEEYTLGASVIFRNARGSLIH